MPRLRDRLEDFVVEEMPLYLPQGEGGHTFVWVEKRGCNTEDVARQLAKLGEVAVRDVGYAGRKDRRAVARQWFSVPALEPERARGAPLRGARILRAERHPHKLKTGQLRGNRFAIVVREIEGVPIDGVVRRLSVLQQRGMPNRFGRQRFGRDGANVGRAHALLAGGHGGRDRREARFFLSALQSAIFNEVLAARPGALDRVEQGDVAVIHGSGGLFLVEDEAREAPRAARFEISATGPIVGTRTIAPTGRPAAREQAALDKLGIPALQSWKLPRGLRARGGRRPLRVRPTEVDFCVADSVLRLRFDLPAGSYASVFLEEVLGDAVLLGG